MKEYNVLQYGAVGDGATNDAFAIQHAIDDCAKNGGGRVVLQSGYVFYSDSIRLRSNVDLHIQKGARLKATGNIDGYIRPNKLINDPKTALIGNPVTGKPSFVFLYGYEADGCTISGEGTIDANGHAFVQRKDQYYVTGDFYPRPTVIYVEKSNHITFKDITIVDAPFWTLHPAGCDDVLIDRIRILNDLDVANSTALTRTTAPMCAFWAAMWSAPTTAFALRPARATPSTAPAKISSLTAAPWYLPPLPLRLAPRE